MREYATGFALFIGGLAWVLFFGALEGPPSDAGLPSWSVPVGTLIGFGFMIAGVVQVVRELNEDGRGTPKSQTRRNRKGTAARF